LGAGVRAAPPGAVPLPILTAGNDCRRPRRFASMTETRHASHALAAGVPLHAAQTRLGHAQAMMATGCRSTRIGGTQGQQVARPSVYERERVGVQHLRPPRYALGLRAPICRCERCRLPPPD